MCALLLSCEDENGRRDEKRREHEAVRAEDSQRHNCDREPCERRHMLSRLLPLVDENRHKQRRHAEINARHVKGDDLSEHAAKRGGSCPVEMAEHGEIEHRLAPLFRR